MNTVNRTDVTPVIFAVRSKGVHIPNGGVVDNTSLAVYGAAGPGIKLEIFDGSSAVGGAIVKNDGAWVFSFTGLIEGNHRITVKAEGSQLHSEPWLLSVTVPDTTALNSNYGSVEHAHDVLSIQYENFEGVALQYIHAGAPLRLATMTVARVDDGGTPEYMQINDAAHEGYHIDGKYIEWNAYAVMKITFAKPLMEVMFGVDSHAGGGALECYDTTGKLISATTIKTGNYLETFTGQSMKIGYIMAHGTWGMHWAIFDNFKMWSSE